MDFASRDLYRRAIEQLARGSKQTELALARAALSAGGEPNARDRLGAAERRRDPGYHLIGAGRRAFEATVGYRPPRWNSLGRFSTRKAGDYIAAIVLIAGIVLSLPLILLHAWGAGGYLLALLALLGMVPSFDAAIALVNRDVTRGLGASILPGLALREGIPSELRTLIVVPVLLTTRAAIEEHIERLEIHCLASPEVELYFALLSDWTDAPTERTAEDGEQLEIAATGIARLNHRYGAAAGGDRFVLLHRRRVWSDGQKQWMGWERKRGKLHELNRLLRGATDTTFVDVRGRRPAIPANIRYVITLDADTRLPRDTARRLVGKMAHVLNRPRFDAATGHVLEGYAVLQPRVAPSLPMGREGSLFQRVFSSASGIDPYAAAVSDVYQDLFGLGSYAGKGIYDVDAFEAALADRVPEGTLLSHDLFEGIFARAGLVSDIEVVEEFPAALRRGCGASTPLGARRLATAAVDSGPGRRRWRPRQRHAAADRLVENAGQPAAHAVGAGQCRRASGGMVASAQLRSSVERLHHRDGCLAGAAAGVRCDRTEPFPHNGRSHLRALRKDVWLAATQWPSWSRSSRIRRC